MTPLHPLTSILRSGVAEGVFPGAVLQVRQRGAIVHHEAVGRLTYEAGAPLVTPETIFDLASLTKPLATTTALLQLVQSHQVDLSQPIGEVLDEVRAARIGAATFEQLLSHSSGLPAWRPYYQQLGHQPEAVGLRVDRGRAVRQIVDWIAAEPLQAPLGAKSLYSDLGFILLGCAVERVTRSSLAGWWRTRVAPIVGHGVLDVIDSARSWPDIFGDAAVIAPTEEDPWRKRVLRGEVHDENAWALGGVAGHAGLFGTADAVAQVGQWWLGGWSRSEASAAASLMRQFTSRTETVPGSSRALGWDTPSRPSSSGQYFSTQSFGHLGFTGTSLWVDPTRELVVAFVSNRVHPTRTNDQIKQFRPRLHDAVWEWCGHHT